MDPPAGGSGSEPSSDPNEQPDSSQPGGTDGSSRLEVDLWCAISSSPQHDLASSAASLANAPGGAMDTNLWEVGGSSSSSMDAQAAGVPWCTDDEHDHHHQAHASFLSGIAAHHDSSIPRFPADSPNLCTIDRLGPDYRQGLGRQESLELLAESWDELEKYSQDELRNFQDDLEQLLLEPGLLPMMPPLGLDLQLHQPDTPNDESETVSSSVSLSDAPDDGAVVTSSGESQPGGSAPSAGIHLKRKGPVLEGAPAGEGSDGGASHLQQAAQHPQQSMEAQKKMKVPAPERPSLPRTSRPRYAIHTRTEVDVIDDGYRWRKYGQKPVKNSAHPRNYYRCTTADCPVRKRVERSTENPSHVLTTYDGVHNHPEVASSGTHARELNPPPANIASGNAEDVPLAAAPVSPRRPAPLGPMPPRLPPSNYITPNIIGHLLAAGSQVPPDQSWRWSHSPQGGPGSSVFQTNIDLLGAHQLFRLQYPLLANMLNLMRNFSRARPSPLMDPRARLFAPQMYNALRLGSTTGGQIHPDANLASLDPQQQGTHLASSPGATSSAGPSAGSPSGAGSSRGPESMVQRLLWLQELMREGLVSETGGQQPAAAPSGNISGAEKEGPENNPDVGDPPS